MLRLPRGLVGQAQLAFLVVVFAALAARALLCRTAAQRIAALLGVGCVAAAPFLFPVAVGWFYLGLIVIVPIAALAWFILSVLIDAVKVMIG